jgi:glyoxylase-like metal-dependent hydrolase (beta-lactamase superfamily II)
MVRIHHLPPVRKGSSIRTAPSFVPGLHLTSLGAGTVQDVPSRLVELVSGVWVATSRWYATTSTVLLDGSGGAVVVDPAFLPDELAAIPADLGGLGVACVGGIATHEHYDHVLWHADLGEVARWSSAGTAERLVVHRAAILAPLIEYLTPDLVDIAGRLVPLADGTIPWSGPRAECIEHDAHAPSHLAVRLPDQGVLLAGDMLSNVEVPYPAAGETLEHYAVRTALWLVPGHGTVTTKARARYDADMRYLDDLLAGRASDDPRIQDPDNAALHQKNLGKARSGA